jgi:hypothetical protein
MEYKEMQLRNRIADLEGTIIAIRDTIEELLENPNGDTLDAHNIVTSAIEDLDLGDPMIDREVASLFKEKGIPAPEGKSGSYVGISTYKPDVFYKYSTDELWKILPPEIDGHTLFMSHNDVWYWSEEKDSLLHSISKVNLIINTALKELLKWVLQEHPEELRKHLEGK